MIDISVFFVEANGFDTDQDKSILANNKVLYQSRNFIQNINSIDYNISILDVNNENIPETSDSDIVLFLDDSIYIQENFIDHIINCHKLFDDYGVLCGPVLINKKNSENKHSILHSIHEYDLKFYGSKVSDITSESNNYPPILGCAISGKAYNSIGYCPSTSKRHSSINNHTFLEILSKRHKIYYVESLCKHKNISKLELKIENLSKKYYDDGYQVGSLLFNQHSDNKAKELWHRFVQSPESFDYNCPRWMMHEISEKNMKYLEDLIVLRCQYQIGFYEGITNKKLI